MNLNIIWQTVITILYGMVILRIAGRKSVAQMTISQTIVMLAIGTVLIEPLVGRDIVQTFLAVGVVLVTLIIVEKAELRWDFCEHFFTGKPVVVIADGKIQLENLKKIRMTVDQLEMQLRQASIASVNEVQWATVEPNGQFGYVLKEHYQPLTKDDYKHLLHLLNEINCRLEAIAQAVQAQTPSPACHKQKPLPTTTEEFSDNLFVKASKYVPH